MLLVEHIGQRAAGLLRLARVRMPPSRSFGTSARKIRAVVSASPSAEWRSVISTPSQAARLRASSRRDWARPPGQAAGVERARARPGDAGPLAFALEHGEIEAERVADHHGAADEGRQARARRRRRPAPSRLLRHRCHACAWPVPGSARRAEPAGGMRRPAAAARRRAAPPRSRRSAPCAGRARWSRYRSPPRRARSAG